MSDYSEQQLIGALRKADAAGDTEAARAIARRIQSMREAQAAPAKAAAPVKEKPKAAGNRGLQLAGRSVAQGAAGVLDMLGQGATMFPGSEPMRWVLNQLPSGRDIAAAEMDSRGFARPETSGERIGVGVGEALTGTALTMGAGAASNARFLTANPVLQLTGAAAGASAAGVAREKGASPVVQTLAGLVGGLTPAAIRYGGPAATRGVLRGGEQGRARVNAAVADAEKAGTTLTVGQATGNRAVQGVETTLGRLPGSAGIVARAAERQGEQLGQGVRSTADRLAPGADAESAGRAITRGVNGPGGFMERTGQVQERLYGRLDEHIDPATRVGVNNTADVLADINPTIPGAPEISKNFQNARIGGLERAFDSDARGVGGVLSRPDVREWMDEMRAGLQSEADFIAQQNAQRQAAVAALNAQRRAEVTARNEARRSAAIAENERLQSVMLEKRPLPPDDPLPVDEVAVLDPVPAAKQLDQQVMGRVAAMADGRLPYEAVQKTRTLVGKEIADGGVGADVPRSKWNPLYGGLSRDMKVAADEAGPHARQAWERANRYTRAKSDRQESIAHVVDKNGGPEAIFRAATAGTKEGATTLRALMRSLPEGSRKEVAAAVLNRMGRANSSVQNADGSGFSTNTFLTNWDKLSPQARSALFDRFGPEFRNQVNAITRTADRIRAGSQAFSNPSGTAAAGAQIGGLASLLTAVGTGNLGVAGGIIGGGTLANIVARGLTHPKAAAWAGQKTPVPASVAIPITLQELLSKDRREKGVHGKKGERD
jgi:hypothetical protein